MARQLIDREVRVELICIPEAFILAHIVVLAVLNDALTIEFLLLTCLPRKNDLIAGTLTSSASPMVV
jgi:hypothetical protein